VGHLLGYHITITVSGRFSHVHHQPNQSTHRIL
jgi:hypothetical protein